jgi:signal transduction histidine kinase
MERQRLSTSVLATFALHGLALITLSLGIWGLIVIWPIPHLGYLVEARTGVIQAVEAGGPAAQAGLRVGDQVVAMYRHPWDDLVWHWNVLPLIGPLDVPIPVSIQRDGVIAEVGVRVGAPPPAYQIVKLSYTVLALLCWLTGFMLGNTRRQEVPGAYLLATFWLVASGVVGVYVFAINASLPLRLMLHTLLAAVLMPAFVAIHVWYPPGTIPTALARRARRWWLGTSCAVLTLVVLIALYHRALLFQVDLRGTPIALLAGCIGSGMLLRRRYRQTTVLHTRRQIRLIGVACLILAVSWLYAFFGPTVADAFTFVADPLLILAPGIIPLAYLVGSIVPDLYHIDRLARRMAAHLLTLTALSGTLLVVRAALPVDPAIFWLWVGVGVLILYRPLHELCLRLVAADLVLATTYRPLDTAIATLATSLDRTTLVTACVQSVQATFGAPAVAVYYRGEPDRDELHLIQHHCFGSLAPRLPDGPLVATCQRLGRVHTTARVYHALASTALASAEIQILAQPGLALWCPMVQADGTVLGIIVLGSRGDGEPYREGDIQHLQRLIDAAGLALANSQAYEQQCQTQEQIRALYRHLQVLQDTTAATIVREIHDEIINVYARTNMEALQDIVATLDDSPLRQKLESVQDNEAMMIEALRLICEQISPAGLTDPFGMAGVLRRQVERARGLWAGACRLVVCHRPQPLSPVIQREALRITREAMMNAIKHANATEIVVTLTYPTEPSAPLLLTISDNGPGGPPFPYKPDHFGLPNIIESARFVGGTLTLCAEPTGGTTVIFTCPLTPGAAASNDQGGFHGLLFTEQPTG